MSIPKRIPHRDANNKKQVIEILYEDEHLIVANKPPGLLVIPDRYNPLIPNLKSILLNRLQKQVPEGKIFVVHRIDSHTSGLVLFAKMAEMHRALNQLFEKGEIEKIYLGVVSGSPPEEEGIIDLPIRTHPTRKRLMQVHRSGKPAITHYKVLEKFQHFCLLQLSPKTGRTHQIRVHLQAIGCPLAVDPLYGTARELSLANIKRNYIKKIEEVESSSLIRRLTLHAHQLSFENPLTGEQMQFEAPPPRDFRALLKMLKKWDREQITP